MLTIGKTYCIQAEGQVRLCADITLNGRGTTLWFGVEEHQADYLCTERSDAFVMALLPTAMRKGHDIVFQTPMSKCLHYQLTQYLIPTLGDVTEIFHPVKLSGPLTAERVPHLDGVGTGFSGGVDCLYTIMSHGAGSTYPLTHIAVFNVGAFDGGEYRKNYHNACLDAAKFAQEQDLSLICLDSNIVQVLPEEFLEVYSFRNLAGALALQSLFSVYLLSSGHHFAEQAFDFGNNSTYDLILVHCATTESLTFYSSGGQLHRHEKIKALADWEPAYRWLHPCFRQRLSRGNCGKCKKCIHTMTALYAYGVLDRFSPVFDIPAFLHSLPQNLGYLLNQDKFFYESALRLLTEHNIPIPPEAYEEAEKLRRQGGNIANTKAEQQDTLLAIAQKLRKNKSKETH